MSGYIQRLSLRRGKFGPAPRFSPEDAVRALSLLSRRTGRAHLSRSLGIGEGTMRTILAHLTGQGLVKSAPMGAKLTKKGVRLLSKIKMKIPNTKDSGASRLTFGLPSNAAQLRGLDVSVSSLQLRDEMVRSGASGGVLLEFRGGDLILLPYHRRAQSDYARELKRLESEFDFAEGDRLLVCFGGNKTTRERALFRAASLLNV